jgi:DNA replication protein DnaC
VDILYIDDFLKVRNGEEPTNGDLNLAFEIINHRLLDKEKSTIISSEKTLDEIIMYDEALMSRVYQNAGEYNISIKQDRNKNYRLKGSKNG